MVARREPVVQVLEKPFGGSPAGARMLIATPNIVKDYIERIPHGSSKSIPEMRNELAKRFEADMTCPLTAGIFTRIVAEAALDDMKGGKRDVTPFWRLIDPKTPLAKKLSCGPGFVAERRAGEE